MTTTSTTTGIGGGGIVRRSTSAARKESLCGLVFFCAFLGADAQLPAARLNCDHYGPAANRLLAQCGSRLWPRLEPEDPLVCLIAS